MRNKIVILCYTLERARRRTILCQEKNYKNKSNLIIPMHFSLCSVFKRRRNRHFIKNKLYVTLSHVFQCVGIRRETGWMCSYVCGNVIGYRQRFSVQVRE